MIAEEVGQAVPEVVSYEENGKDARSVDYSRLTALPIEAVTQQQSEIRQQHGQIRELQQEIRQQQNLLRAQSSAIESLEAQVRETR